MLSDQASIAIGADEQFDRLVRRRSQLAWWLTAIMVGAFFSFIALVAFNKPLLAQPLGSGMTSVGILIGFGVMLLAIFLTALYVWRANSEFDRCARDIVTGLDA